MEMTITRALSELKLIDSRVQQKIAGTQLVGFAKKSSKKVGVLTREDFSDNAKSNYQAIVDLIERRRLIKSNIVKSNSNTVVSIGGRQMTVAEAIERKSAIAYEELLLRQMEAQYSQSVASANRENEAVFANLNKLLETTLGKEGVQKTSKDEIEIISNPYLAQYEVELVDPLSIKSKIDSLRASIEDFKSEVDFVLSESNSINKIDI